MSVLDSAAAIRRALAQVGHADGSGACLENVYEWFGSVQSIGPGAGQYDWAIKGWNFARFRNNDINSAPAGVPVYFGTNTPRTDRNAPAGDVGLSIGGGRGVFTDSPNGATGVMTFAARAAQVRRNILGWTGDFLGHDTTAGLAHLNQTAPAVAVPTSGGDHDMFLFEHAKRGQALGGAGFFHPLNPEEAPWAGAISSVHIVCVNERHFDLLKAMCTQGADTLDPRITNLEKILAKDDGGGIRGAISKIPSLVWDEPIVNSKKNGTVAARGRLGGIDQFKENVASVNPDVISKVADEVAKRVLAQVQTVKPV